MPSKLYERGLAMRKKVLGAAHVEQTLANVEAFRCMREAFAAADAQAAQA